MDERPLMIKEKLKTVTFFVIMSFVCLFLSSCQTSETNKWTPPKFVKEWEIKEIKPGLQTHIVSMTANKIGVFVLVKAEEHKQFSRASMIESMTGNEKREFAEDFVKDKFLGFLPYIKNLPDRVRSKIKWEEIEREKNEMIDLTMKYLMPPRKITELTVEEKTKIFNRIIMSMEKWEELRGPYHKGYIKSIKEEIGRDSYLRDLTYPLYSTAVEDTFYYRIQHYGFDGNFINQWPEENKLNLSGGIRDRIKPILIPRYFPYKETIHIDSRDYLIEPKKILSDDSDYIFLADYRGNKIVKFDSIGKSIGLWRMFVDRQMVESFPFYGATIAKENHILLVGEGEYLIAPKLYEYDSGGKLLRSEELKSKIKVYYELLKSLVPPLIRIERIADMSADNEGNIYLLRFRNIADDPTMIKLTPEWKEERAFEVILKEGFELSKIKEYDMLFKKFGIKKFDSTQMSWIDTEPGFYFPSSLFTDGNHIYVTFLGSKPFGIIDAVVYDKKGKMVGYWKQEMRSHMDWFKKISADIEIVDTSLSLAQYNSSIFIGRTMKVRTGAFYTRSVIQRFQR